MTNSERESINFKLPKTLTKALRAAARERNTTATDLVIQGLHHILGQVPGIETSIETRLHKLETQLTLVATRIDARVEDSVDDGLKQRLSLLEQQYEAIALRLAQIEGAISLLSRASSAPNRRRSYQYHPPQLELQAYTGENLAKRLGVDVATLERARNSNSQKDFESWCRSRDPGSIAWRKSDDGLFHPIK